MGYIEVLYTLDGTRPLLLTGGTVLVIDQHSRFLMVQTDKLWKLPGGLHRTGYLVPEKDDLKLAPGIKYFLSRPRVWKRYTRSARQVIDEKFDLNKQINEQQRLYSLIEKSNGDN